jgi:hypothetical protein
MILISMIGHQDRTGFQYFNTPQQLACVISGGIVIAEQATAVHASRFLDCIKFGRFQLTDDV